MRRSLAGFDGPPQGDRKARFFGLSRKVSGETCGGLTRLENHFQVELPDYEVQGVSDFQTLAERIQSRL